MDQWWGGQGAGCWKEHALSPPAPAGKGAPGHRLACKQRVTPSPPAKGSQAAGAMKDLNLSPWKSLCQST